MTGGEVFKGPVSDSGNLSTRNGTKLLYFIIAMIMSVPVAARSKGTRTVQADSVSDADS